MYLYTDFHRIYFSSYIIWIKKGYQDIDEPRGSSIIKIKGVARVSITNENINASKLLSTRITKKMIVFSIYIFRCERTNFVGCI